MKKTILLTITSILILVSACKNTTENKPNVDSATLTKEVTESEIKLFGLSKEGKISEAFSIHKNNGSYRNIVDGISRNYSQMDSIIKDLATKKVKSLEYDVATRDFLVIDNTNVLETVQANRKLISTTDSTIENRPVILSILWSKESTKWNVSYIHSSYKIDK